jgi:hypothetical protein
MTTSTADRRQPWGRACGLLGACVATLAGVFQHMDPDVILVRAVVSGSVIAAAVHLVRSLINAFETEESLDD